MTTFVVKYQRTLFLDLLDELSLVLEDHMEQKSIKQTLEQLNSCRENGLTTEEALKRQEVHGKNELPKAKKKTIVGVFFSQMNNAMIYILLVAAVISFVMALIEGDGSFFEPILILAIVLLNAVIGAIQELKADKALEALEKLSAPTTVVRRDGELKEIKASELVPGDIVIIEDGRTIPADLRLISSANLKVSEASLTGESVPVEKDANIVYDRPMPIGDRKNVVYMSTPVVYGRGEGVVIGTGLQTEIGQIAKMLQTTKQEETPLQKRLADLSKLLGIITFVLVALLFIIALIKDPTWDNIKNMFLLSISLAVAAVPEGLPAVVTITLALGVQRMVKVHTITRRLPSVETLGAVSVICSDKTGTLTQNVMTVVSAYTNEKQYEVEDFSADTVGELADGLSLCSDASVDHGVYGDPTEIALVNFANLIDHHKDDLEAATPRVEELPFDSVRKMMSTLHKTGKTYTQYTKGAMDNVLKLTTHISVNGKVREIKKSDIAAINDVASKMAKRALRVLALAKKEVPFAGISEENLVFVGLVGMVDPPRPEAIPAVENLKGAGITTIMITGDHADTAYAIAHELGITDSPSNVLTGAELDALNEDALKDALLTKRVFARVSPENKVQIVNALQANGEIVAMTGDGVNDAPSLKTADIGIAMGITGTDVAKGAADMVLTDDNFASIEKAVQEGRGIYANIRKTVWFLLSSNFGEVITMLVAVLVGYPFPLSALHILWVNLITDGVPALALGADSKDPDIMKEKPRDKKESLFANGGYFITIFFGSVIALITTLAFLFIPVVQHGMRSVQDINTFFAENPELKVRAMTYAFTTLGVSQLFHMFGMSNLNKTFFRTFTKKKWFLWVAFFIGFLLQIAVTEIHALTVAFGTVELTFIEWVFLALLSTTPLVIHELRVFFRFIREKIKNRKSH